MESELDQEFDILFKEQLDSIAAAGDEEEQFTQLYNEVCGKDLENEISSVAVSFDEIYEETFGSGSADEVFNDALDIAGLDISKDNSAEKEAVLPDDSQEQDTFALTKTESTSAS